MFIIQLLAIYIAISITCTTLIVVECYIEDLECFLTNSKVVLNDVDILLFLTALAWMPLIQLLTMFLLAIQILVSFVVIIFNPTKTYRYIVGRKNHDWIANCHNKVYHYERVLSHLKIFKRNRKSSFTRALWLHVTSKYADYATYKGWRPPN